MRRRTRATRMDELMAQADLAQDHVVVERVRVGRVVKAAPPVRREGDITILSITDEAGRRGLVLREEIHFRRLQTTGCPNETLT